MIKKLVVILACIFINNMINAQSIKLGFRIEPTLMLIEKKNETSAIFTPYGMYLTSLFDPIDFLELEIRPGYIIGGDYTGSELGLFTRFRIFSKKFYVSAGLNQHSNIDITSHNTGGAYCKKILFKGIGIGYQKDSKLSIDIMYYWTSNKDFAWGEGYDQYGKLVIYKKNMNGIIKVGFSLSWEVLKM